MVTFEKYSEAFLPELISVFGNNVPAYFMEDEEQDLRGDVPGFMDTYYVMLFDNRMIGAGGYAGLHACKMALTFKNKN